MTCFLILRMLLLEIRRPEGRRYVTLGASQFPRHFFEHVGFYSFEGRGVVGKALRGEMIFEFAKQGIALGGIGALDRDALLGVWRGGWCRSKIRAGEPA